MINDEQNSNVRPNLLLLCMYYIEQNFINSFLFWWFHFQRENHTLIMFSFSTWEVPWTFISKCFFLFPPSECTCYVFLHHLVRTMGTFFCVVLHQLLGKVHSFYILAPLLRESKQGWIEPDKPACLKETQTA